MDKLKYYLKLVKFEKVNEELFDFNMVYKIDVIENADRYMDVIFKLFNDVEVRYIKIGGETKRYFTYSVLLENQLHVTRSKKKMLNRLTSEEARLLLKIFYSKQQILVIEHNNKAELVPWNLIF